MASKSYQKPLKRCEWAKNDLSISYHDNEWGVPLRDDRALFELLILEGMQAGLSWDTILTKRARFRQVFDNFNPTAVARYDEKKIQELLNDSGIIRNRLKITSTIKNAQAFLAVQKELGSFSTYLWSFVGNTPIINSWKTPQEVPAFTALSERISKDLKVRGFSFVGPTIIYAYLQSAGLVDDHLTTCFLRKD